MDGVISVIVPVYNVAAYLPQCIESILTQDYGKLELILIDDGSADESCGICDAFARRDNRVRVIHQKNRGAAAAKNAGLRAASGEYLSFVDGDDFLDPGAYTYMVGLLKEADADVVQCAFQEVFRDRTVPQIQNPGRNRFTGKEYLVRYTVDWTCGLMTDKLFRRGLFAGIFFEEGHKIDDEYFTYQGIMNARSVLCDDRIVYHYRRRISSVMLSPLFREQIVLDRIDYLNKRRRKVLERFPELRGEFDVHYVNTLLALSKSSDNTLKSLDFLKAQIQSYLQEKEKTRLGPGAWFVLQKMVHTDSKKLLKKCTQENIEIRLQGLFD